MAAGKTTQTTSQTTAQTRQETRPTPPPSATRQQTSEPELSFEEARDALTEIVGRLEAGNLTLEESLELWERGEAMAVICQHRLDGARARLRAAQDQGSQAPATHDVEE
ncbi:MAG: exodeoxyribonuclease VII small subunit [Sporichthyaceae bacterium]